MEIRKVIVPAAGWGTRSLPASKNIPKEMLPIYNKPVVQYVVEEAVQAGMQDVIFVIGKGKSVIEDHFDYNLPLEDVLERTGKTELLHAVRSVAEMVNVVSVRQKKQLGLGHAVLCARSLIGNEAFGVMLGDDITFGQDAGMQQLVRLARQEGMPVIGVREVAPDKINRYGIVLGREIGGGVYAVEDMIEKPAVGSVESRLAIMGRYVLTPDIFDLLSEIEPGHGGEIQLTDALNALARKRGMLAVKMRGLRFDAGDWVDYLAANMYFALQNPALRDELKRRVSALLEEN